MKPRGNGRGQFRWFAPKQDLTPFPHTNSADSGRVSHHIGLKFRRIADSLEFSESGKLSDNRESSRLREGEILELIAWEYVAETVYGDESRECLTRPGGEGSNDDRDSSERRSPALIRTSLRDGAGRSVLQVFGPFSARSGLQHLRDSHRRSVISHQSFIPVRPGLKTAHLVSTWEVSVSERPIESLPLRDLILGAQQFSRELEEHLEQGFLPKVEKLELSIRSSGQEKVPMTDVTVRRQVQEVLDSHQFADQLMTKVEKYLRAIDSSLHQNVLSQA